MYVASLPRPRFERLFYAGTAIGIIVVVLAVFSIDVPLLSHLDGVSVLVRLHGVIMLTSIALFFAQALLVSRHHLDLHMRLGIFGTALAIAVVMADTATLIVACRIGGDHMPPHMPAPLFLSFGLFNLFTFSMLVCAALVLRKRRSDWHKRLMLLASLLLLDAALARFITHYTSWTLDASIVRNLFILACVAVDTFRYRRPHPAFVAGRLLLVANDYVANWTATTMIRAGFTAWVIG